MFFRVKQATGITVTGKSFKCLEFWGNKKLGHLSSSCYPFFPIRELWMCGIIPWAATVALRETPNLYLQEWQVAGVERDIRHLVILRCSSCQFKSLCPEVLQDGYSEQRDSHAPIPCFSGVSKHFIWEPQRGSLKQKPPLSWPRGLLTLATSHSEFCWNRNKKRERAKSTEVRSCFPFFCCAMIQTASLLFLSHVRVLIILKKLSAFPAVSFNACPSLFFLLRYWVCICACCNHSSCLRDGALGPAFHLLQNVEAAGYKKCLRQESHQGALSLPSTVNHSHTLPGSGQASEASWKDFQEGRGMISQEYSTRFFIFNFWRILM